MNVDIKNIKPNPQNPRIIKDGKFEKLVKSLQDFPEMLEKRPLVVFTDTDGKYVVLGGNMRLKAATELKMKQLPVIVADDWTEEQKKEFLIKDNVGFGEWNWEDLGNNWDSEKLAEWGVEVPQYSLGHDINSLSEDELDINEDFDPVGVSAGVQRVVFIFDTADEAEKYLNENNIDFKKIANAWQVNLSTLFI